MPRVKRAVQSLDIADCLKLVEDVWNLDSPAEVLARCDARIRVPYVYEDLSTSRVAGSGSFGISAATGAGAVTVGSPALCARS